VEPDEELVRGLGIALAARGIPFSRGPSWTTDAPYRETRREAATHRLEGVLTVEMEAAALFAAARQLGVQAAAVFVVADRLLVSGWEPPEPMVAVQKSLGKVLEAVIAWLTREGR
jgi:purine-nucleoside phosphorylase